MHLPAFVPFDPTPSTDGVVRRADVVQEARTWIGTPYAHQHRVKGSASDCLGLVIGVCRALGVVAPDFDFNHYARKPDGDKLLTECARYMTPVADADAGPGHVLVLAYRRDPAHMGILGDYLHGSLSLIHAYGPPTGGGRVEEWNLARQLRAFTPLRAFALPGVR